MAVVGERCGWKVRGARVGGWCEWQLWVRCG